MHRRLALLLTAFTTAFAGLLVAPPAHAVDGWSVDITTTRTVSYGPKVTFGAHGDPRGYWRPHFYAKVAVTCPAGQNATLTYSPLSGNQSTNQVSFTCTGTKQTVIAWPAGAKGNVNVSVELISYDPATFTSTVMATDSAIVKITAVLQRSGGRDCFSPYSPDAALC